MNEPRFKSKGPIAVDPETGAITKSIGNKKLNEIADVRRKMECASPDCKCCNDTGEIWRGGGYGYINCPKCNPNQGEMR